MNAAAQTTPTLCEQAIRYARAGFELFPVSPKDKAPLVDNGFKDATSDPAQVQRWWKREHPDALIGCRIAEPYMVLDIDPRHGGDATWAALESKYGPATIGRQHHSGRNDGGRHIWMIRPDGKISMRSLHEWARAAGTGHAAGKKGWASGIDLLHHDYRYTILPPSPHPDTGLPYMWDIKRDPEPAPQWLIDLLLSQPSPPAPPRQSLRIADETSIADWFSSSRSWNDILGPSGAGWVLVEGDGDSDGSKWKHPTATAASSCSIRHGCLFVYTPNTDFTETAHNDVNGYTRFRAWAVLEHDSDLSHAARVALELRDGPDVFAGVSITSKPKPPTLGRESKAAEPGEPWPDVIPISEAETGQILPFPVAALPDWMQPYVLDIAEDLQASPDLPGVLGIVALSVACLGTREVVISNRWREPLNIYAAVAMPPSSGKSPAFKKLFAPIYRHEKDKAAADEARVAHVEQKRRIIEKAMKRAEDKGDLQEAQIRLDEWLSCPPVVPFRLTVDDATPESVVDRLAAHGGRLAVLSTEGGLFDMIAGRYSETANLDVYLKSWSADQITVDRISRGNTVIQRPILTIGVTVQPSVIEAIGRNPEMVGKGLSARFMYAVPPTSVGDRQMGLELPENEQARSLYVNQMTRLIDEQLDSDGYITIDPDALRLFHNWRQMLEDQRGRGGALELIAEWTAKLESTTARVAALLSMADGFANVDVATMRRAMDIGDYWLAQMRVVLDLWGADPIMSQARKIIDWCRHRDMDEFSVRDLYASLRREFPTADDTRPALMLLTERGWIRPLFDGPLVLGRRGVESPRFAVRPRSVTLS